MAIADESAVGEVRRRATAWGAALSFDAARLGTLALIATEAASNVFHHARDGEILLRRLSEAGQDGIEVIALDRGPGMRNPAQCLADGYSTRGTSGAGLGSIARNADRFDLFSQLGRGTALVAEVWRRAGAPRTRKPQLGAVCVPLAGEEISGDGFGMVSTPERTTIAIIDGLGHGQAAADAMLAGLRAFYASAQTGAAARLAELHEAMRATRGAAGAIAEIAPAEGALRFAGIGNCAGSIHSQSGSQGLASLNGILGGQQPRIREFAHAFPADALLIMHSDGLATRWQLEDYPGLLRCHPSLIAAVLYRDFSRQRDDVTVLAFRASAT